MPSKAEKARRAALMQTINRQKHQEALADMPMPLATLRALFDFLDEAFPREGCNHTLRLTERFLTERHIELSVAAPWLERYGGFCDCEVLANVSEYWCEDPLRNMWIGER